MPSHIQLYGIIIISLMLIFSLIHLGVSIGIIDTNRPYESIFHPEIGLSGYNIIIAFLGIAVSGAGLLHMLTQYKALGRLIAILSGVLGIFTLISLITALIINSKSASYIDTRLYNNMNQYMLSAESADLVDYIQFNHACCGEHSWTDWARFEPGTTTMKTSTSTTTMSTDATTTESSNGTTTTLAANETTTTTVTMNATSTSSTAGTSTPTMSTNSTVSTSTTLAMTTATNTTIPVGNNTTSLPGTTSTVSMAPTSTTSEGTSVASSTQTTSSLSGSTTTTSSGKRRREIDSVDILSNDLVRLYRRRRQTPVIQNSMVDVPFSVQLVVPISCCMNLESISNSSNSSSQLICSSNQFYTTGCLKGLLQRANNQDMGIGIINCFLLLLAFGAVPFLLPNAITDESQETLYNQQFENMRNFDSNQRNYPAMLETLR